ncbi:MAG: hypothetical protein MUC84_01980 [Solirubrobacteraceae bacterium]|jgi:hypothetical protein|nr:hypothetical protein [Solirubrobacteraceae bacterium]MCU0312816.1 hypothetical protein [Solirubrobacteraceae bacterium]
MTTVALSPPREHAVRLGLWVLGAAWLAIAALQILDPAAFVDVVGPYGAVNEHYVRDLASWYAAGGILLVLAASRPAWRVPVLLFTLIQGVLHLVNHVFDIGDADPGWMGPLNAVLLAATLGVTAWLLSAAQSGARR